MIGSFISLKIVANSKAVTILGYIQKPFAKFSFHGAKIRTNSESSKCFVGKLMAEPPASSLSDGVAAYEVGRGSKRKAGELAALAGSPASNTYPMTGSAPHKVPDTL